MPNPEKTDKALSDAARAVVRDPGDPRIDAHLAALGLGPDAPSSSQPRADAPASDAATRQLAAVSASLEAERRRVRALAIALVVAVGLDIALVVARLAG